MATIKVKFQPPTIPDKEGVLYYQVVHNRVIRRIVTGHRLYPHEWSSLERGIVEHPHTDERRRAYLLSIRAELQEKLKQLRRGVKRLERAGGSYTADDVVELYVGNRRNGGFITYARGLVRDLRQAGKVRLAETYTTSVNSFGRFCREEDVALEAIDSVLMMEYESYLKSLGLCPNSISFYMRNLRAIYNRAVDRACIGQRHPFKHVYTGVDRTVKRAIGLKEIRRIRDLDLHLAPAMAYARDLFLFSFYTRGMSFVDMAHLKKQDLQHGVLTYRRQKTGQLLSIKWERPMQEIVDRYATPETPYLMPIIKDTARDARRQYLNAEHLVNSKLRRIGRMLELPLPLTTYVARHTWASIARSRNIPLSVISAGMGHDSEQTTRIYLASLNTSEIDKANKTILNML